MEELHGLRSECSKPNVVSLSMVCLLEVHESVVAHFIFVTLPNMLAKYFPSAIIIEEKITMR